MAFVLSGSALTPVQLMMCPRNLTVVLFNSHLLGLSVTWAWADSSRFSTLVSHSRCSRSSFPNTSMSSIWQTAPSRPKMWFTCLSNISGALKIPNGTCWKHTCQKVWWRLLAGEISLIVESATLSFVNRAAPDNCASASSTLGIGWVSLIALSLSAFKSIHMTPFTYRYFASQQYWHVPRCV